MSEVVSGCMFRGCPFTPEWTVRGQLVDMFGIPAGVDLQICNVHLRNFGLTTYDADTGTWNRSIGSSYAKIDIYQETPTRIRVIQT